MCKSGGYGAGGVQKPAPGAYSLPTGGIFGNAEPALMHLMSNGRGGAVSHLIAQLALQTGIDVVLHTLPLNLRSRQAQYSKRLAARKVKQSFRFPPAPPQPGDP